MRHPILMRIPIAIVVLTGLFACSEPQPMYPVTGVVISGPSCPVETNPPDPNCADRPVVGALLLFTHEDSSEFETVTNADGRFEIELPDGTYVVTPQAVEGLMGTAPPFTLIVDGRPNDVGEIAYDTGIR